MLNKRGQEGFTLPALVVIIVLLVVAAILIFSFRGFFSTLFGFGEVVPSKLEAATQACKLAIQANLAADYCYNFRDAGGNNYVNCEDSRIKNALEQQQITTELTCTDVELVGNAVQNKCKELSIRKQKDAVFNGGALNGCSAGKTASGGQGTSSEQRDTQRN